MAKFTLVPDNNCIKPTAVGVLSYHITGDDEGRKIKIKNVVLDLSELGNNIEWSILKYTMPKNCTVKRVNEVLTFTFKDATAIEARKDFSISNIQMVGGSSLKDYVNITFRLLGLSGPIPDAEYENSTIRIDAKTPEIINFTLNPSIVRAQEKLSIKVKCKGIDTFDIRYEDGTYIPKERLPKVDATSGDCEGIVKNVVVYDEKNKRSSFYLRAKLGEVYATKNNVMTVNVVTDEKWHPVGFREKIPVKDAEGNFVLDESGEIRYNTIDHEIVGLVGNEYDKKMWAFVRNAETKDAIYLWYSHDGLEWYPYETPVTSQRIEIPERLVHVPALFYKDCLYFIAGRKTDIGACSASIEKLEIGRVAALVKYTAPPKFTARSLHAAVVFKDNIWIIGGADKLGNGLKDVWIFDGTNWDGDSIKPPADFPERCRFGATAQLTKDKSSIWIAGGTSTYDGDIVSDIWGYDLPSYPGQWACVEKYVGSSWSPLRLTPSWLKATALTFLNTLPEKMSIVAVSVSERESDVTTTKMVTENRFIVKTENKSKGGIFVSPYELDEISTSAPAITALTEKSNNYTLTSVGFNGCNWIMATVYMGANKIKPSGLFYLCPPERN